MRLERTFRALFFACLALPASAACTASGSRPVQTANADSTSVLYKQSCATCHGLRGEGKQLGTMNIPSLREGLPLTDSDERLSQQIHDGGKGMPPFKYTLDDRQIADLVRFIRQELQKK